LATHLRKWGLSFRIFGPPMDTWVSRMPQGMCLKSDGFASNLYDPDGIFTLRTFCAEQAIPYADMGVPVRLDTFTSYALAFAERMVPELENRKVIGIERLKQGFSLRLENGEICHAARVVMAVGVTHFEHVPENLAHLPPRFLSHSARYTEV